MSKNLKRQLAPRAPSDDLADVIAGIEQSNTPPALSERARPAPAPVQVRPGYGAMVWKQTGDHSGEYVMDPNRKIETTPLAPPADAVAVLINIAKRRGVDPTLVNTLVPSDIRAARRFAMEAPDGTAKFAEYEKLIDTLTTTTETK